MPDADTFVSPAKPSPGVSVIVSDFNRMRGELLAAELRRRQPRFEVTGCAAGVAELLQLTISDSNVALISGALRDGPLTGFRVLQELHRRGSRTRAVMLLDRGDPELVLAAFRGGARGAFCRSGSVQELINCIEVVHQGQIWAGRAQLQSVLEALSALAPLRLPEFQSGMTRREEQIAALLVEGADDRQIARRLHVPEHNASESVARLCIKLGICSRVELVLGFRQREAASKDGAGRCRHQYRASTTTEDEGERPAKTLHSR